MQWLSSRVTTRTPVFRIPAAGTTFLIYITMVSAIFRCSTQIRVNPEVLVQRRVWFGVTVLYRSLSSSGISVGSQVFAGVYTALELIVQNTTRPASLFCGVCAFTAFAKHGGPRLGWAHWQALATAGLFTGTNAQKVVENNKDFLLARGLFESFAARLACSCLHGKHKKALCAFTIDLHSLYRP